MIIYDVYITKCVKANRNAVMRTRNVLPATPHDVQPCSIWFAMWLMISNQTISEAPHLRSLSRYEYRSLYAERVLNRFYVQLNRRCYHVKPLKQCHDHSPVCQQLSAPQLVCLQADHNTSQYFKAVFSTRWLCCKLDATFVALHLQTDLSVCKLLHKNVSQHSLLTICYVAARSTCAP